MRKTAVYRDNLFISHNPGAGHPESPDRLRVIYDELDKEEIASHFIFPQFEKASPDWIELIHTGRHIQEVATTAGQGAVYLDADTRTSADSYDAALLASGALIDGISRIDSGEIDNGFCFVRPPGHHAERERSMGFCLFNNIAVAARWALNELGLKRIMIIDWDLHHGNGTQKSFYNTDKVLFCSTHQFPYYPGSGAFPEIGEDRGEGYTINVPLTGGHGDVEYARLFNDLFAPLARVYQPQLILVSCGFDIYKGDPLGAMRVTPAGFAYMTRVLVELAAEVCEGKLLITLEGGYNLDAMRDGSLAVLTELCGSPLSSKYPVYLSEKKAEDLRTANTAFDTLDQAISLARNWWDL